MKDSRKFLAFLLASLLLIALDSILLIMESIGTTVFIVVLVVSIILLFVPILLFKGTSVEIDTDSISISAPFVDERIPFDSITSMSSTDSMDFGIRTFGFGGLKYGSGEFSNKSLGGYTLAANSGVPLIIVMIAGKKKIAFNLDSLEETRRIFDELTSMVGKNKVVGSIVLSPEEKRSIGRRNKLIAASIAIFVVAIFALVGWLMIIGDVSAELKDDRISIDATMMQEDVMLDDIVSVEWRGDVSYGSRTGGLGNSKVLTGNFENDEFGRYRLAVYKNVDPCIVIHTTGKTVVFNLSDEGSLHNMYTGLTEILGNRTQSSSAVPVPMIC